MYKEEKSFNVLRGRVPDFSSRDIILSYTIDQKPATELEGFPGMNSGYVVNEVKCDSGVTAKWNNYTWALENIENPQKMKQIKCSIDFRKSTLNGTEPVFEGTELVPVKIGENGTVIKADTSKEWYNYDKKEWANAIIPLETEKEAVAALDPGATIEEAKIESYFVWIPKYSYRIFDMGTAAITDGNKTKGPTTAVEIRFGTGNTTDDKEDECKTPMLENGVQGESGGVGKCEVGKWMTHPAFLAFNTTGFWVGKFETGHKGSATPANKADASLVQIKPAVSNWNNLSTVNAFDTSKAYKENLQSHMMKNTEWGAVAYLTQSIYGRCNKQEDESMKCEEITINSTYTTGNTASTKYADISIGASTTGNYSGIYDMRGGAYEQVSSTIWKSGNVDLAWGSFYGDPKYYDVYKYANHAGAFERRILGDATGEMGWWSGGTTTAFFGDVGSFVFHSTNSSHPYFVRGGDKAGGSNSGIFTFHSNPGIATIAFRICLAL